MTKHFSRTRHDFVVGFWAIAPAIAFPWIFLAWNHHIEATKSHIAALDVTYSPVPDWMIMALFAVVSIGLTSLVVVIRDINSRPLPNRQRRLWTTLTLIGYPFGGCIYWMVNLCTPRVVGTETPNDW